MVDPTASLPKTGVELADVVRRFAPEYTLQYGHVMMPSQKKALSDIVACCTEALGGRLYRCDDCNEAFWRFHCCRNRACPKCHGKQTQQWLQQREVELLPCVEFLRRFLQHVLPRGFHRVRYYGLWHHSKRNLSNRAWLLLILDKPTHTAGPVKIADLLEALSQLAEIDDGQDLGDEHGDHADNPCCPHCGSERTTFLGQRPRPRMP